MVQPLYSQYQSGTQLIAGNVVGSVAGVSGINPLVDRMNLVAPAGNTLTFGSISIPSGVSATLISAPNLQRKTLLIYNFAGSYSSAGSHYIVIGNSGVTHNTGYQINENDFYEVRDTGSIYANKLISGGFASTGADVRYIEITA